MLLFALHAALEVALFAVRRNSEVAEMVMTPAEQHERTHQALRAMVLPLLSVSNDGAWRALGSSVVIHALSDREALLVTAAHTVTDFLPPDRNHPSTPPDFRMPLPRVNEASDHSLCALVGGIDGDGLAVVVPAMIHSGWDLALLRAVLPSEAPRRFTTHMALDSSPVSVGERVVLAGYSSMNVSHGADVAHFDLTVEMRSGEVLAVDNDNGRNGPTARVNIRIDSGMSGGPLFVMRGQTPYLRGVARSDMSLEADIMTRGSGVSASTTLIWPALVFPVPTTNRREETILDGIRLLDLVREGRLRDAGRGIDHVQVVDGTPSWAP